MRIDYQKQAVEEFADEDLPHYSNVVVGYMEDRIVAVATGNRSFMIVPLSPSEEELAFARANTETVFELHPGHWKLIRKSAEPFAFEQVGEKWQCRLMSGQTFPATMLKGHRTLEGPTWIVQRDWREHREEAVLYFDAKLLMHALKNLAANGDQNQIAITLFSGGALRITAKSAPGCMIAVMPLSETGLVKGCKVEGCENEAHRVVDLEPRCKDHLPKSGNGEGSPPGQ